MKTTFNVVVHWYVRSYEPWALRETQTRGREVSFEEDEYLFETLTRILPFDRWVRLYGVTENQWGRDYRPYYNRAIAGMDHPWVSSNRGDEAIAQERVRQLQVSMQNMNLSHTLHLYDSRIVHEFVKSPHGAA